ncbi:hypothetical protein [Paludisphaera soli]|uniref:hypothetical protein n=1 Tax=Paludisphaera soli TaxID=2712865 RepID=UPI0013EBF610|nr:hypothetical protein [Paludisphaera soli]
MRHPSPFLSIPPARAERWALLREFFDQWHPPLRPAEGDPAATLDAAAMRLGVDLPAALREWYAIAGRRADAWSRQDVFVRPDRLRIEDGRIVFYEESQAVVRWGVGVEGRQAEDPPVFVSSEDEHGEWLEESPSISLFALQRLLCDLKWSHDVRCRANGPWTDAVLTAIESHYPRLALPAYAASGPSRCYGHRDLVIGVEIERGEDCLWVASRAEAPFHELQRLLKPLGMRWDSSSYDWPSGWVSRNSDY